MDRKETEGMFFGDELDNNSVANDNSLGMSDGILFEEDEIKSEEGDSGEESTKYETKTNDGSEDKENKDTTTDTETKDNNQEDDKSKGDMSGEDEEDEVDLDSLLGDLNNEIDESNKNLDKIEEQSSGESSKEIGMLRDSLKKMEDQLRKLTSEKMDLTFRNAELESYGLDNQDPKVVSLIRFFGKAKDDDKAKTKSVSLLKEMLYDLTGEDFDESKINSDIDILSKAELYNTAINPNLKSSKKEEDGFAI